MILSFAERLAADFLRGFSPSFDRLEIAGSIRRKKPDVKDIELVGIISAENQINLAELLPQAGYEGIKPGVSHNEKWPLKVGGRYWRLLRGCIRYDLFFARPENWGLIFAIRTGPAEFSASLLGRWKKVSGGGYSKNGVLYRPLGGGFGEVGAVETPSEEDIFRLCKRSFVNPENRK